MKRLGIFVFFDKNGIVDEYVFYLINCIKDVVEDLIIVINGLVTDDALARLKAFSSYIFVRPNIGFDGGAYKDVFTKYLPSSKLLSYDEIVMMNNTFFGPFLRLDKVFSRMDGIDCDFWGLTRNLGGGRVLGDGREITEHIQSYFIVLHYTLFSSKSFMKFWKTLEYPITLQDAIGNFEIEFSVFFKQAGFHYISYADVCGVKLPEVQTAYMPKALFLIKNAGFPVVKKKHMNSPWNYTEVNELLNWLSANTAYDTSLIVDSLKKRQNFDLERFYASHARVFIYGHGKRAKGLHRYFKMKGWTCVSFIVSQLESPLVSSTDERIVEISTVDFLEGDGVVVALWENYHSEVLPLIKARIAEKDIYIVE